MTKRTTSATPRRLNNPQNSWQPTKKKQARRTESSRVDRGSIDHQPWISLFPFAFRAEERPTLSAEAGAARLTCWSRVSRGIIGRLYP